MGPKKGKKNNKTKYIVTNEEVLNMSGVGKSLNADLNESGTGGNNQQKDGDSFIFTGAESEIQPVTTDGNDNNSSHLSGFNSARDAG